MKYLPKILPYAEKLFLALLLVGAILKVLGMAGMIFITIGLLGLASVFFLTAYTPSDVVIAEGEKAGFNELLVLGIIPKVLGMSMSISTVGILFYLTGLEGYALMLTVGTITIIVSMLIGLILRVTNTAYIETLFPKILKALIVVIVAIGIGYESGMI